MSVSTAAATKEEDYSDEKFDEWAKWNCKQIRTKTRNFIGTTEMTQAAFLKLCNTNPNSFYRFMNFKGPYSNSDNQTYDVFLGEKLTTQAAFLRTLGNTNTNSLRSFMNLKHSAGSGASNVVYRKAYVLFEKKRILEGKKKTKKRQDHEAKQGSKGSRYAMTAGCAGCLWGKVSSHCYAIAVCNA
ncbi:hypothetical protein BBO99_00004456 [Phytophthora kernoviae]|uniref:DUF7726 domain-containing protein n=2 Tax=Phytophthora kernoviae TaxID=325452 RepID=A0A3R7J7Y2_9STRA|nr:hypothetical protein G195_005783 [Phytophthora kernoviae 00238/432]RLN44672.1 hypothetical protein BBI17_005066 [Phytophthora kernoviae]RLN80490.1 hypothetical protein BBO99_00004456 [Phytophthora kernoviae]